MGIKGEDEQEVDNLFLAFDDDGNGILDEMELLTMIKFLIRGHHQITGKSFKVPHNTHLGPARVCHDSDINLMAGEETLQTVGDLALSTLHECQWDDFVKINDSDDDAAGDSGLKKLMKKQMAKIESSKSMRKSERVKGSTKDRGSTMRVLRESMSNMETDVAKVSRESSAKVSRAASDDSEAASNTNSVNESASTKDLSKQQAADEMVTKASTEEGARREALKSLGTSKVMSRSSSTVRLLRLPSSSWFESSASVKEISQEQMARELEEAILRDKKIQDLLEKGENMMKREVCACMRVCVCCACVELCVCVKISESKFALTLDHSLSCSFYPSGVCSSKVSVECRQAGKSR